MGNPGATSQTDRLIGTLVDRRYRIDERIARGGMSTVYRAIDTRLDRPVAIKIMDPGFAGDEQFQARFEFEARSVARLKHPALVAVYDHGRDGDLPFLVMELVDGGTLRDLLRERGPMPPHAVRAVAEPVLDALGVAHASGLVHRDIKPENVLISDTGEVKIADFGLVRAIAAAGTTSNSVILGTAAYLSPEQVATGQSDTRGDVYAMGILIFEMLTGQTPFTGDTSLAIAYQRLHNDVPRPSSRIQGVPSEFDELVTVATNRDASGRYADAAHMADALRDIAAKLHLPACRVPAPHRPQPAAPVPRAMPSVIPAGSAATTTVVPQQPAQPKQPNPTRVFTAMTPRPEYLPSETAGRVPPAPRYQPPPAPRYSPPAAPRVPGQQYSPFPGAVHNRKKSRRIVLVWLTLIVAVALALAMGGWFAGIGAAATIPNVDGLSKQQAQKEIEKAGFSVAFSDGYSNSVGPDLAIGTDPAGGSSAHQKSTVTLILSKGQPRVPELPKNADRTKVVDMLSKVTLKAVDTEPVFSIKVPAGKVAQLTPAPGAVVPVGSTVKIAVSKGPPPKVTIPAVTGKTIAQARTILTESGLEVTVRQFTSNDASTVITQFPVAGREVDPGSSVTLFAL
ncbi:Stk1 family PASTA domain-containing Ser/Thr kinase [Smaragdicoccus niigatensis]|uniref:Stk1 family PASTA domain-containing Ser/Thr kinase n=1 Tax=Smaragdicoccus niigatensis TaxID=359359 RepID=UPI000382098E|nr:Stk1 family PASTA domain-containing Ser/Thr kinase [Smaragdicoccus niigatensis]